MVGNIQTLSQMCTQALKASTKGKKNRNKREQQEIGGQAGPIALVLSADRLTHSPQLKNQTTPTPASLLKVGIHRFFRLHCYRWI